MRLTGFKYLWVDALCIVQGPRGDWTTESAKMADVYGGAFLTISAAISLDVQHGFQESLTEHFQSLKKRKLHPTFNPLYGRGWALQERILSPRVLIFGKGGMFWECREYASLSYMQGKSFPYIPRDRCLRLKQACGYEDWMTIVEDYTKRSLTHKRDTFPALSGCAMLYHQFTKHDYLAGMWKQSLLPELLWKTYIPSNSETVLPSKYIAPSWSWASCDHFVVYNKDRLRNTAKVINAQIELKDPEAPFGQVTSGSIVLCGPLVPESEIDRQDITAWNDISEAQRPHGKIWYMLLCMDLVGQGHGLILQNGKGAKQTCFARTGVFAIWGQMRWGSPPARSLKPFQECEHRTITII